MGLVNLVKLEKLKINVYKDKERNTLMQTIKVMFNPETYSLSYKNGFSKIQAPESGGNEAKFSLSKPSELSLKLIFDGTGVAAEQQYTLFADGETVDKKVDAFLEATMRIKSSTHEPGFLRIVWGTLKFDCRLAEVTVNYTLFNQSGNPLRAELDTSFISDVEVDKRNKLENKNSPDLTHKKVVKAGDTLLLLCESVYGTPDYYLKVAQANKLINFRNLEPGRELYFPPIDK